MYDLVSSPRLSWQVLTDVRTNVLTVFEPGGQVHTFDLSMIRSADGWTELQGEGGRPLPVEVCMHQGGFHGRWLAPAA